MIDRLSVIPELTGESKICFIVEVRFAWVSIVLIDEWSRTKDKSEDRHNSTVNDSILSYVIAKYVDHQSFEYQ